MLVISGTIGDIDSVVMTQICYATYCMLVNVG